MRLSATKALMERQDVIVVATVSAIYGLGDPGSYLQMVVHLTVVIPSISDNYSNAWRSAVHP